MSEQTVAREPIWVRDLDLWTDRTMHGDPYPRYAELRGTCPVAHSGMFGGYWLVSRYDDILRVLQDPGTFSSVKITVPAFDDPLGRRIPGEMDPPEHTKYRQIIAPLFSPQRMKALEGLAHASMGSLLDDVRERHEFEFMASIAIPFPFEVFLRFFGFPEEDYDMVRDWENAGLRADTSDLEARKKVQDGAKQEIARYLTALVADRAAHPRDEVVDIIDQLVAARYDGSRPLDTNEMARIAMFLFKAGLHTTTNVLGNIMCYLSTHLDARDELVAHPELVNPAVEELMRWESIVTTGRVCTRDAEVGGREIKAGEPVLLLTGSAGRDESIFDDPDGVDFERGAEVRHMMFGAGPHRCLGSHMARMELRVALEDIHRVIPTYRADPDRPAVRVTGIERGTDSLHLLL